MKGILFVILFVLGVCGPAAAEIYRWTDDAGNIVFSDTPKPGAEVVELSEPTIVPGRSENGPEQTQAQARVAKPYDSVTITKPEDESTIRSNVANVDVGVRIVPRLQTEFRHKVQLLFDGQAVGEPSNSLAFSLPNVDRGAHTLQAHIVDENGKIVKRSPGATFFVHKISVNNRAQ